MTIVRVIVAEQDGVPVAAVEGEIDISNADQIAAEL